MRIEPCLTHESQEVTEEGLLQDLLGELSISSGRESDSGEFLRMAPIGFHDKAPNCFDFLGFQPVRFPHYRSV